MKKILNVIFQILKYLLMITAFVLTLYIIVYMYQRLNKSLSESVSVFAPYLLIFVLFAINIIFRQKGVTQNIFYNICCCLVFATITYCGYRAVFDQNMLMNDKMGYGINFNYFSDVISSIKVMLYGLSIANVCFMFDRNKKKEIVEEKAIEPVVKSKSAKTKKVKKANNS